MIYNIYYFNKSNFKTEKITTNILSTTQSPNASFLKDKMEECNFCIYKNKCLKMINQTEDLKQEKIVKQFLNESILDCPYYLKINATSEYNILEIEKTFDQVLDDEIKNRIKEC